MLLSTGPELRKTSRSEGPKRLVSPWPCRYVHGVYSEQDFILLISNGTPENFSGIGC